MRQLKALFLTLLLALSLAACGNSAPNVEISETVLNEAKNDVAVLVDVRSPEEFKAGHLPNAINIPLEKIPDLSQFTVSMDFPIYVYCQSGNRSKEAKKAFEKLGYTTVIDLGGIKDYKGKLEK